MSGPRIAALVAAAVGVGAPAPVPLTAQRTPPAAERARPLTTREADPLRLTLDAALEYAAGSNPELRRARNSTALNASESRSLWFGQLLPSASLTLFSTAFTGNLARRATDNFGNPIANPGADWNYFSNTTHRLGLAWSVRGPSLLQAYRTQELTNRDRDLNARGALNDVQAEVQRLYMDALEQRELLRAEEELIEARRVELDVAERLFGLALRTRVDVLSAELAVEQQRLAHQQQEAAYQRALLALRTAMGVSDERPLELLDERLPLFDPSGLDADALLSRASGANPSVLRSDLAVRTGEVALARERADWWPQVDLGVSVSKQAYEPFGQALFEPPGTSELESQFFVRFSIPIFNDYFEQRTQQRQAAVDLENRREEDRQTRLELEETIRGALLDLRHRWAAVELSERSLVIAQEALRLAREEYRLGTRSFAELQTSVQDEADIRRQVIQARHQFVDDLLTLEAAVGAPVRDVAPPARPEG